MPELIGRAYVGIEAADSNFKATATQEIAGALGEVEQKAGTAGNAIEAAGKKTAAASEKIDGAEKNTRNFRKSLIDVNKEFGDFGNKASKFVSLPVAAALGFATKAASDLSESANVTGLTFGAARGEIDKFVSTSARGLGISERAARDATTQFGGLLQNLGFTTAEAVKQSQSMTVLASDLASAFNTDPAEAALAIGSALRGETESIRRFNVFLTEEAIALKAVELGLSETGKNLDANAKAQATLAIVTESTSRVQGDFANTADGVANAQRILKAEVEDAAARLGANLLPAAQSVLGVAIDMTSAFTAMSPELQKVVLGVLAVTAAAGPAAKAIAGAASFAKLFTLEAGGINKGAIAGAAGLAVLGLAAGAFAKAIADSKQKAREFVEEVEGDVNTASWSALTKSLEDNFKATSAAGKELRDTQNDLNDHLNPLGFATREFLENVTPLPNKLSELRERTSALADSNIELKAKLNESNKALDSFAAATGLSREEVEQLALKNEIDLTGSYGDVQNALFGALSATRDQTGATSDLEDATATLADKTASAEDRLKAFTTALDLALGGTLSVIDASIRHQEALVSLTEALAQNGTSMDITTEKGRAVASAFNDVIRSAEGEVEALIKSGAIAEGSAEQKAALVARLEDLKNKFPQLSGPIDEYIAKIKAIPDTASTEIIVDAAAALAALARLDQAIKALPRSVNFATTIDPNKLLNDAFRRERGGPVKAGQLYVVGEKRPELFVPKQDGVILPDVGAADPRLLPSQPIPLGRPDAAAGDGPLINIERYYATERADLEELERTAEFAVQAGRL